MKIFPPRWSASILLALALACSSAHQVRADEWNDALDAANRNDFQTAVNLWRDLADHGSAAAAYNLGNAYLNGNGVPKDLNQAERWWRKSADQGNAHAQFNLGELYAEGTVVPQDFTQAAVWWRKAADQGYAEAQHNLAELYRDGHGVPQDYKQAADWLRKAADQGYVPAEANLGIAYAQGLGVLQDYKQAVEWTRKAAEQGDAGAQVNLSMFYDDGQGVPEGPRAGRLLASEIRRTGEHRRPAQSRRGLLVRARRAQRPCDWLRAPQSRRRQRRKGKPQGAQRHCIADDARADRKGPAARVAVAARDALARSTQGGHGPSDLFGKLSQSALRAILASKGRRRHHLAHIRPARPHP